jgi:hypothetical protein
MTMRHYRSEEFLSVTIGSPSKGSGGKNSSQGRSTNPLNSSQGTSPLPTHTMVRTNPLPNLPFPYLASLNIHDLTKLTNDPILHDATWPNMPTKFPSDILKFEGKLGEDPTNHVMTFHLWCSSNNIMDDSIHLRLFQRTLTGSLSKWYVDKKSGSHATFESLAKAFLSLFNYSFLMILAKNFSLNSNKPMLSIFPTTSMNGIDNIVCVKQKPSNNNVSIGFLNHSSM